MENEQPNAPDPEGKKPDKPAEKDKETPTDLEKLKTSNDEFEKELVRGRELKTERQKLEMEAQMGSAEGGHVEPVTVEETPREYRDRIDKEISEGKHAD